MAFEPTAFYGQGFYVIAREAAAAQTIPVPTQNAVVLSGGYVGSQTIAVPTQTATVTVTVSATASQTVPAPTSAADLDSTVSCAANQTVPVPTQDARTFGGAGRRIKAKRAAFTYIAKRAA